MLSRSPFAFQDMAYRFRTRCEPRHGLLDAANHQPCRGIETTQIQALNWRQQGLVTKSPSSIKSNHGGEMSDQLPEETILSADPEVVAHIEDGEDEEVPCTTFQVSCSVHWGES